MESVYASLAGAPSGSRWRLPLAPPTGSGLSEPDRPGRNVFELPSPGLVKPARVARGTMRLRAIRDAGRVSDFMWEFVSASVAPLLYCDPVELRGKCMQEVAAGPLGHPALVARYRRVMEDGTPRSFEQVHRIGGTQAVFVHSVMRLNDGVTVTLTRSSARARAIMAGLQAKSPQSMTTGHPT